MISAEEVRKIASLARLNVDSDDLSRLSRELGTILDYIKQIEAVDTGEAQPMSHVHGIVNVFREDNVTPSLDSEELLKNAPDYCGRFIRVPLIVE